MKDLSTVDTKEIEKLVDVGLRHKYPKAEPTDYLKHFLSITRQYAYATRDDSWGELEKEFAILIRNYETYKRFYDDEWLRR